MTKRFFTLLMVAGFAAATAVAQIMPQQRHELFVTADTSAHPYRIPAITQTRHGALLAVGDYRPCGADIGFGRVDLMWRRGSRHGRKWGPMHALAIGSGIKGQFDCGFGDAAMVADWKSNEVLLLSVCGSTVCWHPSTTRQNPNRIALFRSKNGGKSWEAPIDVTEPIYGLFDASKHGAVASAFVGSGRLEQSHLIKVGSHYRVYAALWARPHGNRVIYTDDFGKTFHAVGGENALPAPEGNEPKCAELPNGDLLLSSRAYGGRFFNIFHYTDANKTTGKWLGVAFSGEKNKGTFAWRNGCNGGILIVPARNRNNGKRCHIALQSIPLGPGRYSVGVYYKPLYSPKDYADTETFARHWMGPVQLTNRGSGYSELLLQKDGQIGVFMEENAHGADYTLVYLSYSLRQLTNGRFDLR